MLCWAVLLALPLVVRFGRSAAQIRQIGPPLLFQTHRSQSPVVRFGRSAAQILQNGPRQLGLLGCAPCSLRFGRSAAQILQNGPRQLGQVGCAVLAAQQPKSSKTDLASFVRLAVLLALPLVVRVGRSTTGASQADRPIFCQDLQIISCIPGMSSSVGRGQGP